MRYFSNLKNIRKYLINNEITEDSCGFFSNYYLEWLKSDNNRKYLRIYSVDDGLFGTNIWAKTHSIGSIDLDINSNEQTVKIPFWLCNDKTLVKLCGREMYGKPLDDNTANEVKNILFDYAEKIAKENSCVKIQRDVNYNLREFNQEISKFGFELTGEKASDNPAWLVSTKLIGN